MSIDIRPDPTQPQGGYALLGVDGGAVSGDAVGVAIRNAFSGRWLGQDGWQPEKVTFGPYPVSRDDGRAVIRVGPEIVNGLEEYTGLTLEIGGETFETSWPDDVLTAPGAALLEGLETSGPRARKSQDDRLVGALGAEPDAAEEAEQERAEEIAETPDPAPVPGPGGGGGRTAMLGGLLALLLVAAGLGYWFFLREEPLPEPEVIAVPEPVPAPEPAPAPEPTRDRVEVVDPCAPSTLDALSGEDFGNAIQTLRDCAGQANPDTALALVEDAAERENPEALLLFGKLYDETASDAPIEDGIGLTFSDAPTRAAEYYYRAVQAGSEAARAALEGTCARLEAANDTLSRGARQDYCTE